MKTDEEKIKRNQTFVVIAMVVVAIVVFVTFLSQNNNSSESKTTPISQKSKEQSNLPKLGNSKTPKYILGEDPVTVKGKISVSFE